MTDINAANHEKLQCPTSQSRFQLLPDCKRLLSPVVSCSRSPCRTHLITPCSTLAGTAFCLFLNSRGYSVFLHLLSDVTVVATYKSTEVGVVDTSVLILLSKLKMVQLSKSGVETHLLKAGHPPAGKCTF